MASQTKTQPNLKFDKKALQVFSRFKIRLIDLLDAAKPDFEFKGVKTPSQLFQREDMPKYAGQVTRFRKFLFRAFEDLLRYEGENYGLWFCEPHTDKYKGHIAPDYFFTHILPSYKGYAEPALIFFAAAPPKSPDGAERYKQNLDASSSPMREDGLFWLKKFTDTYFKRVAEVSNGNDDEQEPDTYTLIQIEEMAPKTLNRLMALEDLDLDGERQEKEARFVEHLKSEDRFYDKNAPGGAPLSDIQSRLKTLGVFKRDDLAKPAKKVEYEGVKNIAADLGIDPVNGVSWGLLIDKICEILPYLDEKAE